LGRKPIIEVVESGYGSGWREAERRWIAIFRQAGRALTNLRLGEGLLGISHSDLTRQKMSLAARRRRPGGGMAGKRHSCGTKAKISASRKAWCRARGSQG
jgi:hypothetical protein